MDNVVFSILLVVVGLFVGAFIMIIINKLKIVKNISENRDSNVKNYNVINDSIRQLKQSLINIRKKIPRLTD